MFYTIYKITNKINGKFYIGKHQTYNLDDGYMGSGVLISQAIRKHGLASFEKEIMFVFDTEDEMNRKEVELVTISLVEDDNCYNLGVGGEGGPLFKGGKHSEETKQRLRERNLGKKVSDDTRIKISASSKGRIVSRHTRDLISKNKSGVPRTNNVSGINDVSEKISKSMSTYYKNGGSVNVYERTDEIIKKTSTSMKKYHASKTDEEKKLSDEHKKKISQSVKETGVINENVKKTIKCPHCNKEGQELAMKRHHFNNCKNK